MGGDRKEKVTARVATGELARLSATATASGTPDEASGLSLGTSPDAALAVGTDRPAQKAVEHRPTSKIAKEDLAGLLAQSDLARVVEDDVVAAELAKQAAIAKQSATDEPVFAKGSSPEAAQTKPQSLPAITPPDSPASTDVVELDDDDRKTRKMDAGQFQELIHHGVPMERRQRAQTIDDPERLKDALREMGDDEDVLAIPVEPSIVVAPEPATTADAAKPADAGKGEVGKSGEHPKAERHHRAAVAPITRPPSFATAKDLTKGRTTIEPHTGDDKPAAAASKRAASSVETSEDPTEGKRETAQVRRFGSETDAYRYPNAGRSDVGLAIAVAVIILGAVGSVGLLVL